MMRQATKGVIFCLALKGLAGGMLAKAVHDASWSSFVAKLAYKAEEAHRIVAGAVRRCRRNFRTVSTSAGSVVSSPLVTGQAQRKY